MMTPGIIISTFLASRLDSFYLSIIFAVFMFYSSIQMFIGKKLNLKIRFSQITVNEVINSAL